MADLQAQPTPRPARNRDYQTLPGRRWFSVSERSALLLADDHLLMVRKSWFSEEYRRFFLRDIEAITVRYTAAGIIGNVIFALTLLGAIALLYSLNAMDSITSWVALALLALVWVIWLAGGGTCEARLHTAVATYPLPSLSHRNPSMRALSLLDDAIRREQQEAGDQQRTRRENQPQTEVAGG